MDPSLKVILGEISVLKPECLWKTLLNYVVKVRIGSTDKGEKIFIKTSQRNDDIKLEFERTCYLRSFFKTVSSEFDCVEVLAYYEQPEALILRSCPGESLFDKIRRSCGWRGGGTMGDTLESARAVGYWLRHLESASAGKGIVAEAWEMLKADTALARENIKRMRPPRTVEKLVASCSRIIEDAASRGSYEEIYIAHCDFHPENFLITSGPKRRVSAIDCRLSRARFMGYDALMFEYYLNSAFGIRRYRPGRIQRVLEEFLKGYGRNHELSSDVANSIRAAIVLSGLVYLMTIGEKASLTRRVSSYFDRRVLARWL